MEITPFSLTAIKELFPFLEKMLNNEIKHFQWSVVEEIDFRKIQEQDFKLRSEIVETNNLGIEKVLSKVFYFYDDQSKLYFELEAKNNSSDTETKRIGEWLYEKKLAPSFVILLDTSYVSDGKQQRTLVKIKIYSLSGFNLERFFESEIYKTKNRIKLWLTQPK